MSRHLYLLISLFSYSISCIAQQNEIDSLKSVISKDVDDFKKVRHLLKLSEAYSYQNSDTGILYAEKAKALAEKIKDRSGQVDALSEIGWNYYQKADYPKALETYFKAEKIATAFIPDTKTPEEKIDAQKGLAVILGSLAMVYKEQMNYPKALEYNFNALKMNEELGSKRGIASNLSNIGILYKNQKNYAEALNCLFKSVKIFEELDDKNRAAIVVGNIGNIYKEQLCDNCEQTQNEKKELSQKAMEYYQKGLKLEEELGHKTGLARNLGNIGMLLILEKKYDEGEIYLLKALSLSEELGALDFLKNFELAISELYYLKGDFKKAYEFHKQYSIHNDSMYNEKSSKQIAEMSTKYETEKKEQQIALLNQEKETQALMSEADNRRKNIIILSIVIGLILVIGFTIYVIRLLRISHKQKDTIEEKQKEILDSIHYAKRIQKALLPTENYINKHINRLRKK